MVCTVGMSSQAGGRDQRIESTLLDCALSLLLYPHSINTLFAGKPPNAQATVNPTSRVLARAFWDVNLTVSQE
jgi:hypothetical protein